MEKISIARRRKENQKSLFSLKTGSSSCLNSSAETAGSVLSLVAWLESVIGEKGDQKEKRQFALEITSGLKEPLKIFVSIQGSDTRQKKFFTVKEAARLLRVSENTLYRQLRQGDLPGLKIGRQWRVLLTL